MNVNTLLPVRKTADPDLSPHQFRVEDINPTSSNPCDEALVENNSNTYVDWLWREEDICVGRHDIDDRRWTLLFFDCTVLATSIMTSLCRTLCNYRLWNHFSRFSVISCSPTSLLSHRCGQTRIHTTKDNNQLYAYGFPPIRFWQITHARWLANILYKNSRDGKHLKYIYLKCLYKIHIFNLLLESFFWN